jgi:hypothetical protein
MSFLLPNDKLNIIFVHSYGCFSIIGIIILICVYILHVFSTLVNITLEESEEDDQKDYEDGEEYTFTSEQGCYLGRCKE